MIKVREFLKLDKKSLGDLFSEIPESEYREIDTIDAHYNNIPGKLISGLQKYKPLPKLIKKPERPMIISVSRYGPKVIKFLITYCTPSRVIKVSIRYNFEKQTVTSILYRPLNELYLEEIDSLEKVPWDI